MGCAKRVILEKSWRRQINPLVQSPLDSFYKWCKKKDRVLRTSIWCRITPSGESEWKVTGPNLQKRRIWSEFFVILFSLCMEIKSLDGQGVLEQV